MNERMSGSLTDTNLELKAINTLIAKDNLVVAGKVLGNTIGRKQMVGVHRNRTLY